MNQNGAFLILFKDNKREQVFLVRRSDYPIWVLTGGGIDKGETPKKAALREGYEETGFKVKLTKSLGVYEIVNKKGNKRKTYLFEGRVISGVFKPEYPSCLGEWFSVNKLPLGITYRTKIIIQDAIGHSGKKIFQKKHSEITLKNNILLMLTHPFSSLKFLYKNFRA